MDADRFDSVVRSLSRAVSRASRPPSRRGFLTGLASGLLAALAPAFGEGTDARKRKKKKKKKKKSQPCTPNCAGKSCGDDGCGGVCGRCNGSCSNNTCICPSGSRLCNGVCQQCCNDFHCEGGRTCQNGACACPPNKPTFCPIQGICGTCCDNIACCGKLVCEPREVRCLANRTCGCEDGRPTCFNTGLCCLTGEECDPFVQGCTAPSDRNLKTNVASVDATDMLGRVRELPIATWNYTSDDPAIRHIGPMAQDFAALFGVGADDRHIHPLDGQGVALAAIQGLLTEVEALRQENAALAARLQRLEAASTVAEPAMHLDEMH
jgi:hypothetical protein